MCKFTCKTLYGTIQYMVHDQSSTGYMVQGTQYMEHGRWYMVRTDFVMVERLVPGLRAGAVEPSLEVGSENVL